MTGETTVGDGGREKEGKEELPSPQQWLSSAHFKEVLAADSSHKSLFVLVENEARHEQGILLMNKQPFDESPSSVARLVSVAKLSEILRNDVYGNYSVELPSDLNAVTSQFIYPASEKQIAKYRAEEKFVLHETPEDYETITCEYIEKHALGMQVLSPVLSNSFQWVYNFLDGKAEAERVVARDDDPHNGFLLAPDIKWDGVTVENLYLLAIVKRRGIRSVRDLTADDLPLLENLRDKCMQAIVEKYGVREDQLKTYFHYQPSFFHLHVHFVSLKFDAPASTTMSAILLDDVINNLRINPLFYKKATLTFTRKQGDPLLDMFRKSGRARP